jgi:uncharacterized membrane protein
MIERGFGVAEGVSRALSWSLFALLALWLLLLLLEGRSRKVSAWISVSGVVTALLVAAAILRPTRVTTRGTDLFPKVVVLLDRSWRLDLKAGDQTREQVAQDALHALQKQLKQARVEVLGFGEGAPLPFVENQAGAADRPTDSDLTAALRALSAAPGERPKALVVVSDGRLTSPSETATTETLKELGTRLGVPIHTVALANSALPDASIRKVGTTGAAVAHQKLALQLSVGCSGGLACDELPITVEELLHGEPPAPLAQGTAKVRDGVATLELPFTLDRAGRRLVRVRLEAPEGDRVPENNQRLLTFDVTRERVRLLHVAGRPTYDVRALRMWLKADESIDLIAFFILRTTGDSMQADDSELALIPFPVDELFTEHLPSFDAVILQDIDAVEYKLERHLPALARYVRAGGGLIMVGGPSAFMGGGYAGSPLGEVLPVTLPDRDSAPPLDMASFEPRVTPAGRAAPALRGVRELLGERLPQMLGSNTLGPLRPGAIALWEHPDRRAGREPMPMLALGDSGDGRAIALGVDGTHLLQWSELGERSAGRAYGALWEGLVGWLMRDPRYESARLELTHECRAGAPATLNITRLPGAAVDVKVTLERLGEAAPQSPAPPLQLRMASDVETATLPLGALTEGGYTATVHIGSSPPARFDFACESGGPAFADSRPDPALLERISHETGGISLQAADAGSLKAPPPTHVESQRVVAPLLPAWVWALLAAGGIGAHWYVRRRAGLL